MRYDPRDEVLYRLRMARNYLEEVRRAMEAGDYRLVAEASQLAAENAAKAVIAVYRVPSWTHDPYHELMDLVRELPRELRTYARELAEIAHRLAPEHGRATYGDPLRGLTPWELYSREDAERFLRWAVKAVELAELVLSRLEATEDSGGVLRN